MLALSNMHLPLPASTPQAISPSFTTLEEFQVRIFQEFIQESAIDPALFEAAIQVHRDLEILSTGDVETPIHDALNWRYTRFGKKTNKSFYAAIFYNENGTCWQAKLSNPIFDQAKQKVRKYETPKEGGSRAFLPPLPLNIRKRISDRYRIDVPMEGSFWEWLKEHPEIPIIYTEGGKKALSLLSLGYVAIALYGVNGGYRRQIDDTRILIDDIAGFVHPNRKSYLAFDQDIDNTTRQRVNQAVHRFGCLLAEQEAEVAIVSWDGSLGKGVDDLIVSQGYEVWEKCYIEALLLNHWQIWQRIENQLTYPVALRLNTHDLSTLQISDLPSSGILAISSCKGTGKTKFVAQQVAIQESVLLAGHRVCLMRNLCNRLQIDYRGDLDKVAGRFINGSAYTLRVGFCVDSLLAISPEQFSGCILVLDEVVQVLRHLLTSSTCAKDGKRPTLLARLRQLIQGAQQVIIADADLDDASIHYIQDLREADNAVFLIQNDYKPEGYAVRLIDCPDRSTIMTQLLNEIQNNPQGQTLFVATDSKTLTKTIARLMVQRFPAKKMLLINSETSGGEEEREFMQTPDGVLERKSYDIIICSPSVSTGVSIETKGVISKVYGIFSGHSSTDIDITQALSRVREPVERIVWCAKYGSNFSKVSRSTSQREVKSQLREKTSASISLVRSSLREDVAREASNYDWKNDPHIDLYSHISAAQNFAMRNLSDAVAIRLKIEGHHITIESHQANAEMKSLLAKNSRENREMEAEALVAAPDLSLPEVLLLEQKEFISLEEQLALNKFYLKDFYCLDILTVEDVLWDVQGKRRKEMLGLEEQLFPNLAVDRTVSSIEKQGKWQQGICTWDISQAELQRRIRQEIGIETILKKAIEGWKWTFSDLAPYAEKAREMAPLVKKILNFTISPKVSDVQIVHQLLSNIGIRVESKWCPSPPGHSKQRIRVYSLDSEGWQRLCKILEARRARRTQHQTSLNNSEGLPCLGSPPLLDNQESQGDQSLLSLEKQAKQSIPVAQKISIAAPASVDKARFRESDSSN